MHAQSRAHHAGTYLSRQYLSEFCVFMPSIQINGEYRVHLALRSTQQERASDQLRGAGLDGETL